MCPSVENTIIETRTKCVPKFGAYIQSLSIKRIDREETYG